MTAADGFRPLLAGAAADGSPAPGQSVSRPSASRNARPWDATRP